MNKTSRLVLQCVMKDKTDYLESIRADIKRHRERLTEVESAAFVLQRDIDNIRATLQAEL